MRARPVSSNIKLAQKANSLPIMKLCPVIAALLASTVAPCATFTWTGNTDGNWNTAANWTGGVPASANTTALVFDSTAQPTTSNDIAGTLTLNSLTIANASGARTFGGNPLSFSGSNPHITREDAAGNATITNSVQLNSNLRLVAPAAFTSRIEISGVVSGPGGIIADEGISVLSGLNSYSGATVVRAGALLAASGNGVAATSGISVETDGEFQLLKNTFVNRPLTLSGGLTSSARQNTILGGTSPACEYSGAITVVGDSEIRAFDGSATALENYVDFPVSGAVTLSSGKLIASTAGPGNILRFTAAVGGTGDLEVEASNGVVRFGAVNVNGTVSSTGSGGEGTVQSLAGDGALEIDMESDFFGITITGEFSGNRTVSVPSGLLELENDTTSSN